MPQNIETLKQSTAKEVVEKYHGNLKRYLRLLFLPLKSDIQDLISGKTTDFPEKFDEVKEFKRRGKVANFLAPKTAEQLFIFAKEWRERITKAQTEAELLDLKERITQTTTQSELDTLLTEITANTADPTERWAENEQSSSGGESWTPILETEEDESPAHHNAIPWIVATESVAGAMYIESKIGDRTHQQANRIENLLTGKERKLATELDSKTMREAMEQSVESLKKAAKNPRFTPQQVANINKSIEGFQDGLRNVDATSIDLFNERLKLGNTIPEKALKSLNPEAFKKLEKIAIDIVGKNAEEIKTILASRNIEGVSDELIEVFTKLKTTQEVKSLSKVLTAPEKAIGVLRMTKSILIMDVACFGLDIRMFNEMQNEAEMIAKVNQLRAENKRDQAWTQLRIGGGSIIADIGIIIWAASAWSAGWPIGVLGWLAVGALTMAVSMGVDSLYFDVQDFYKQNKEDFIRQPRAQLKEAILQFLRRKKWEKLSLNDTLGSPDEELRDMKLQDARWSLFFLEEIGDEEKRKEYPLWREYKQSGKSEEDFIKAKKRECADTKEFENWKERFDAQKATLDAKITLRITYIKKALEGENNAVLAWLQSSQGMYYLSQLAGESEFYAERMLAGKWTETKTYEENLKEAQAELQLPPEIEKNLQAIAQKDPALLYELAAGAKNYLPVIEDNKNTTDEELKQHNQHLQQNTTYLLQYVKMLEYWVSREEKFRTKFSHGMLNFNYITAVLASDFQVDNPEILKLQYKNFNEKQVKILSYANEERTIDLPISSSTSQNILYRLANEFYGYTGKNDAMELMQYYGEGTGHVHGLYYKDGRYINNDWAHDGQKIDLSFLDDLALSEGEVNKQVAELMKKLFYENITTVSADKLLVKLLAWPFGVGYDLVPRRKSMMDTPTESIDTFLNDEFEAKFAQIVKEELSVKTKENQTEVKNQISDFVTSFASENATGYVELPYYLVIAAKRAGLGDLEKIQFSWKQKSNGEKQMIAVGQRVDLRNIHFEVEKQCLEKAREDFSEEENHYIASVDLAHQQLQSLRNVQGAKRIFWESHRGDLDIPTEIANDIDQHRKDWNIAKERFLHYEKAIAVRELLTQSQEYSDYFTNLYRGILLSLNTYSVSNDVDTMAYFQQAMANGYKDLFDEKGNLLKENVTSEEDAKKGKENYALPLKGTGIEEFYNAQLERQQYEGKTIKELRSSEERKDKEIARRYSEQIITAMLESGLLKRTADGKIEGFATLKLDTSKLGTLAYRGTRECRRWGLGLPQGALSFSIEDEEQVTVVDALLQHRLLVSPYLTQAPDIKDVPSKTEDELTILNYTATDLAIEKACVDLQKNIEGTDRDINHRQGKRGDLLYNPEGKTFESYATKTKIELQGDKIKVPGFSRPLDIASWIRLINYIHWYKATYPNPTKELTHETGLFTRNGIFGEKLLIKDATLKTHITNLTDKEIDEIVTILNTKR